MIKEEIAPEKKDTASGDKWRALRQYMARFTSDGALVAFSGGVDSALLLYAAHGTGGRLAALTTHSASMPLNDLLDAREFCALLGVRHILRETHELENPLYVVNDANRCYHCKYELFDLAREVAAELGLAQVFYGYTASDTGDERPGHRAAVEQGVRFPLAELGFTKEDIRALMRRFNLPLADKPASPCLASRVGRGIAVSERHLEAVAATENILRTAGLRTFRVRVSGAGRELFLRIECDPREAARVLPLAGKLNDEGLRRGYRWVTLDLGGYKRGGANR